jgi:hypothetical protein
MRYNSPEIMSRCCLKSFLALLFGAGVLGGFPASALAGDKIQFSHASETLAKPKADLPDTEQPGAFSGIEFGNPGLDVEVVYPMMPPPAPAPSRRNDDLSLQNRTGGLGSGSDRSEPYDAFGKSLWESDGTNYSSNPDSKSSNYLSAARAWGTPENPDGLGLGMDRMDSRNGQANPRLDSLNPLGRRDRQGELGSGAMGERSWAFRKSDANGSSAKTSIADLLKQQGKSSSGAGSSLFKSSSLFPDSRAWGSLSVLPPDRSLTSPMDSTEPGYNADKELSSRATSLGPGKGLGNQDEGNLGGMSAMRSSGNGPGPGSQATQPPPKPPPSSTPGPGQPQKGGARLSGPKMPGSLFN